MRFSVNLHQDGFDLADSFSIGLSQKAKIREGVSQDAVLTWLAPIPLTWISPPVDRPNPPEATRLSAFPPSFRPSPVDEKLVRAEASGSKSKPPEKYLPAILVGP